MKVTLYIYALQWCEVEDYAVEFSMKSASLAQFLSEYFIHILGFTIPIFIHVLGTHGRNYDMYLGLGMRYEVEICTIVISVHRAFKWCPFHCRLNFDPKSWKAMDYSLCLSAIFGKIWPASKMTFRTSFESSFDAGHNGTTPSFTPHSHTKIHVFPWTMIGCLQYCDQQKWSFQMMAILL